jgi:hypothetical protein
MLEPQFAPVEGLRDRGGRGSAFDDKMGERPLGRESHGDLGQSGAKAGRQRRVG